MIGLPAFILAELLQDTTLLRGVLEGFTPPEEVPGLFYLLNSILCFLVFEAVRRPRVVSVSIPLRRATILGLILSLPTFLLHQQVGRIHELLPLPGWMWIAIASVLLFLISRLHEFAVNLVEREFNLTFRRAQQQLGQAAEAILRAGSFAKIEHLLVNAPVQTLGLASAAVFRDEGGALYRRQNGAGWEPRDTAALDPQAQVLAGLTAEQPLHIDADDADDADDAGRIRLPSGLRRPVLAIEVGNPLRRFGVALYGPHLSGADLDVNECAVLGEFAARAAVAYAQVETDLLRQQIKALEQQLGRLYEN